MSSSHPLIRDIIELREQQEKAPAVSPIVGGNTAQPNKYPWQVIVFYIPYDMEYGILCSGTTLNKRTLLTAAHCCEFDTEQRYV